jgi:chaperonin GroES
MAAVNLAASLLVVAAIRLMVAGRELGRVIANLCRRVGYDLPAFGTWFANWVSRYCCGPTLANRLAALGGALVEAFDEGNGNHRGETQMAVKTAAKAKKGSHIVPLADRVVVKRAEAESKTSGGIVLPDTARDKPQKGEVVAIGDGHVKSDGTKVPLTVKEGDRVIFSSYAGEEITIADQELLLLRESDILATF